MSILSLIKVKTTTDSSESLTVAFEDRGGAEGNVVTNMLGADHTSSPAKLLPRGRANVRVVKRRTKGGVTHINVNCKRTEHTGLVTKNPSTDDLVMQNARKHLMTQSISVSVPSALGSNPQLLADYIIAFKADGESIIAAIAESLEDIVIAS